MNDKVDEPYVNEVWKRTEGRSDVVSRRFTVQEFLGKN